MAYTFLGKLLSVSNFYTLHTRKTPLKQPKISGKTQCMELGKFWLNEARGFKQLCHAEIRRMLSFEQLFDLIRF